MSLLPPTLSAPAPVPTGNASSASSTSSAASSRGDEAGQGDGESFGDVLSRSLAASGEAPAKAGGKPAASLPVKRTADDKKSDTPEAVNTAALLFVPLETRIAKAAGADAGTAATADGSATTPLSATAAAEASTATAAPVAAAAANDASLGGDTDAAAPQTLLASGLPVAPATPAKGREAQSAALASANDEAAIDLPAAKAMAPAAASDAGQARQFSARDERPGDEARELPGTDTRVEQKPGAPKAATMAAANDAADPASANVTAASAPAAAVQAPAADATFTAPGFTVSATATPANNHALASSQPAAPLPSQAALTPEVGSGEWGQALGRQMLHMGKAGEQVAELQLNPPGLGPLKVTLSMNDNQVQAMFVSAHASVRAAVEAALPQLRGTLADNGISLGDTSVNSGSQQQPAFAQGQDGRPGQPGAQNPRTQPGYLTADAAAPAPTAAAPAHPRGKVDTYA